MIQLRLSGDSNGSIASASPSEYSEAVRTAFHGVPGVHWDRTALAYVGPPEAIDPVIAGLIAARIAVTAGALHPVRPASVASPYLHDIFRAYQREGTERIASLLHTTGGALLADDMGLGKTCQAISAIESTNARAIQVFCPAVVVSHWRSQISRWSRDPSRWLPPLSYGLSFRRELPPADAAVYDEVQYLASQKSKTSKAVRAHSHQCLYRLGLSGSPINVRPADVWNPLDIIHPGRWGTAWAFQKRYCDGHYEEIPGMARAAWIAIGSSRVEELAARLQHLMVRRTKSEILDQLPPLTREIIDVEIPRSARKSLCDLSAISPFAAAELADWESSGPAATGGIGQLEAGLAATETHKISAAVELATEIASCDGRVLLVTHRRGAARDLASQLSCPVVTGETPADDRRNILLSGTSIAVATMGCITTGIDLTEFDTIIFVGLHWVPTVLLQLEARLHRITQHKPVTAIYLVAAGTIDERIREVILTRLTTISVALGDPEAAGLSNTLSGDEDALISSLLASMTPTAPVRKPRARKTAA